MMIPTLVFDDAWKVKVDVSDKAFRWLDTKSIRNSYKQIFFYFL